MSLLSPESLGVFVSPTELVAVLWRGFRPQIAAKRIWPVAPLPGSVWAGAAHAFGDLLAEFSSCKRVRVVLSSHFTPCQLLPWRDDVNDAQEELALARLAFSQTYGDLATGWQVELSDAAPGIPKVAAAVDADLLAALAHGAAANKTRIDSIQPYFAAAVNHWRKRFHRGFSSWLVLHEEGRLCLGLIEHGQWRWLRHVRVGADWQVRLPDLLDNEVMLAGVDTALAKALVFSPNFSSRQPDFSRSADAVWDFASLSLDARLNFSPVTDSHFGLALWTRPNAAH